MKYRDCYKSDAFDICHHHIRKFSNDFKTVYRAINEEEALENLVELEEKWVVNIPIQSKTGNQTKMYYLHSSNIHQKFEL